MKDTQANISLRWEPMAREQAHEVHQLHRAAVCSVPENLVRVDGLNQFLRHATDDGVTLVGYHEREMVAYGVLGLKSSVLHHMAKLLALDGTDIGRFAILDGASVAHAWRGRGLQRQVILARLQVAREHGRSLVAATVAPGNLPSLRALLCEGFEIRHYAQPYGDGAGRLVMLRDECVRRQPIVMRATVPAVDETAHQAALATGLIGYGCSAISKDQMAVYYGHSANQTLATRQN